MATKLKCSFCDRDQYNVYKLIINKKVGICNACVSVCAALLLETPIELVTHYLDSKAYPITIDQARGIRKGNSFIPEGQTKENDDE